MIRDEKEVWVLYLDIVKFHKIEFRYGYKVCRQILAELENEIDYTLKQQRSLYLFSMFESRGGDDFVVYFVPGKELHWDITEAILQWVLPLEEQFNRRIRKLVNEKISLRTGLARCTNEKGRSADYLLYVTVKEAFLLNKSEPDPEYFSRREELTNIIKEPGSYLKIAFQPIITRNGEIYGFEALSRIPGTSTFNNIANLFPFAEKIGQLYAVETICRRQSILSFLSIAKDKEVLFLNINPQVLADPEFASGSTRKILSEQELSPSNVVLEITERNAIEDFDTLRDALAYYRNQGFMIALDDVGAGYSSLQSIAELHPDFLKVDRSLINGVNSDPIKWALLETFVTFSKRIGCRIIAEGVETAEEMRTVIQLGVDYIQGYFVARPDFQRVAINPAVNEILEPERQLKSFDQSPILPLLEPLPLFEPSTPVSTVESYFRNRTHQWLVGVTENQQIVGVVQRDKLFSALGTRYGVPLYLERTISLLMDKNFLIIEDTTPLEVVSRIAMQRPDTQLYDGIIITNQRKPIGMVSVANLMKAMAEKQIQIARGANPLTGLPGNIRIDQEIKQRLERRMNFSIIYVDLNQFKHFNDLHGFQQGDIAIKMLAEVLLKTSGIEKDAFVGHIGGDDFIVILSSAYLEELAQEILNQFTQACSQLTGAENLSVALACLTINTIDGTWTPLNIAEKAAQVKKEVKGIGGNAYLLR
jgi:diguanylate cyclase (GGDEF)-like protein